MLPVSSLNARFGADGRDHRGADHGFKGTRRVRTFRRHILPPVVHHGLLGRVVKAFAVGLSTRQPEW